MVSGVSQRQYEAGWVCMSVTQRQTDKKQKPRASFSFILDFTFFSDLHYGTRDLKWGPHDQHLLTWVFQSISAPAPGPSCPSYVFLPLWWWSVWLRDDAFGYPAPPVSQMDRTAGQLCRTAAARRFVCSHNHPFPWAFLKKYFGPLCSTTKG